MTIAEAGPFFFGEPGARLFGFFEGGAADRVVVLCQPPAHEYLQFHRALRQLSADLAAGGVPALRFDLRGCGDSEGDDEAGTIAAWIEDLDGAIEEALARSGAERVCLVGLRLGASLAVLAAARRRDVDTLVLWDPVVRGERYLEESRRVHAEMLRTAHVSDRPSERDDELVGFALDPAFRRDLLALDLTGIDRRPARRALVIESAPGASAAELVDRLRGLGTSVEARHHTDPELWTWIEDVGRVHVPRPILRAIADWIREAHA